jgi:hypothetical protein
VETGPHESVAPWIILAGAAHLGTHFVAWAVAVRVALIPCWAFEVDVAQAPLSPAYGPGAKAAWTAPQMAAISLGHLLLLTAGLLSHAACSLASLAPSHSALASNPTTSR